MVLLTPEVDPKAYDTTWPWYHASFDHKLTSRGRKVLESCGVVPENVDDHIREVRGQAWKVFPFPCIGQFFFIEFAIADHPEYEHVVKLLSNPDTRRGIDHDQSPSAVHDATGSDDDVVVRGILGNPHHLRLLDVGTCLGQDLRMLHFDGAQSSTLYGTDIFPDFEAVGHHLFRDKVTFAGQFIAADILDDTPDVALNQTAGLWDFVTATMFLHQFDLPTQKKIAARLLRLLRPVSGSMILGNNTGQLEATEIPLKPPLCVAGEVKTIYRHSRETMQAMWESVIDNFGTPKDLWKVSCQYDEVQVKKREEERERLGEISYFEGDGQRRIFFTVEHL